MSPVVIPLLPLLPGMEENTTSLNASGTLNRPSLTIAGGLDMMNAKAKRDIALKTMIIRTRAAVAARRSS
ncbi:hypothetical protein A6J66_000905 [Yersinia enterocolitica]|nr:hypothetical protein A6J66_000905 [Yersinia enterocolitica]